MGKMSETRTGSQTIHLIDKYNPTSGSEDINRTSRQMKRSHILPQWCHARYRLTRFLMKRSQAIVSHGTTVRLRLARRLRFRFLRSAVFLGFRLWLKEIRHPEKLPKRGPALIVSNHVSYYDWSVLASVLRKRTVFLGAKELQIRPIVQWLMKLNTLIYINRDHPGLGYFREVMRQFEQGQVVVVYPEGHRSRTGKQQPARLGFIKLALAANIPIIPVGMKGTYEILPPHKRLPRFKRCEIFVGDPIFVTPDQLIFKTCLLWPQTGVILVKKSSKRWLSG